LNLKQQKAKYKKSLDIYIPGALDWDSIRNKYPLPEGAGKHFEEYVTYFTWLLVEKQLSKSNSGVEKRKYYPLNSEVMKSIYKEYKSVLEYLCLSEVIEKYSNGYLAGGYSRLYRLKKQFSSDFKNKTITSRCVINSDQRFREMQYEPKANDSRTPEYVFLRKVLLDLTIDFTKIAHYIRILEERLHKEIQNEHHSRYLRKKLQTRVNDIIVAYEYKLGKLKASNRELVTVDDYGRLHTCITNLPKELRAFITWKGEALYEIDIKASQPYLSQILLKREFWTNKEKEMTLYNIKRSIYYEVWKEEEEVEYKAIMLHLFREHDYSPGNSMYLNWLNNGDDFYDQIKERIGDRFNLNISRDEVKKTVLRALYCDNKSITLARNPLVMAFYDLFPETLPIFQLLKTGDKRDLPRLLQKIESYLMLEKCARELHREEPAIPIVTIHDSITTTIKYKDKVEEKMKKVLTEGTGFPAKLAVTCWQETSPFKLLQDAIFLNNKLKLKPSRGNRMRA
jgi:hypothetical protein